MAELNEELRDLAHAVAAIEDADIADAAATIARLYRYERLVALGMIAVDSMLSDGPEDLDHNDPNLVRVREKMRDRLKELLAWAQSTGRR